MQVFCAGGKQRVGVGGWGRADDTCGKTENAAEILTRSERLDPRLPALSAGVALDSCTNLRRGDGDELV